MVCCRAVEALVKGALAGGPLRLVVCEGQWEVGVGGWLGGCLVLTWLGPWWDAGVGWESW